MFTVLCWIHESSTDRSGSAIGARPGTMVNAVIETGLHSCAVPCSPSSCPDWVTSAAVTPATTVKPASSIVRIFMIIALSVCSWRRPQPDPAFTIADLPDAASVRWREHRDRSLKLLLRWLSDLRIELSLSESHGRGLTCSVAPVQGKAGGIDVCASAPAQFGGRKLVGSSASQVCRDGESGYGRVADVVRGDVGHVGILGADG
ncbi:Uncharacterised protein [Mycobacteroides abscessus subsp. bolletii]|nr:Uncharacterised protein [Mycobacteroides abscessus]SKF62024.1 Uncharacterised protein [Mycobacteroides abscessus subsp. bolletii]SKH91128.1 Uncharacterised protein [Mycobacteroides abscessus subsp. bolletii]